MEFVLAESVIFIWNPIWRSEIWFLDMTASSLPMLCSRPHCKLCGTCGLLPGLGRTQFSACVAPPLTVVSQYMLCTVMQKGHQHQIWTRELHCSHPATSHCQWTSAQSHSRTHSGPCHPHQRTTDFLRSLAVSTNFADCGISVAGIWYYCIRQNHDPAECPIEFAVSAKSSAQNNFWTAELIFIKFDIQEF
jgi:hypothetical protein